MKQIRITEGHDGGSCFWIMPVRYTVNNENNRKEIEECSREEISIDEEEVRYFLYFLSLME